MAEIESLEGTGLSRKAAAQSFGLTIGFRVLGIEGFGGWGLRFRV